MFAVWLCDNEAIVIVVANNVIILLINIDTNGRYCCRGVVIGGVWWRCWMRVFSCNNHFAGIDFICFFGEQLIRRTALYCTFIFYSFTLNAKLFKHCEVNSFEFIVGRAIHSSA